VKEKEGRPRAAPLIQSAAVASTSSALGLRMTISAPFSGRYRSEDGMNILGIITQITRALRKIVGT
jgi:hypothetical protein